MAGEVQKWADKAMFKAEEIDATKGPEVHLLSCNPDPLGTIAAAALMYEGKSVQNLAMVTDDQRRYYLEQVQRSVLEAPLEFVNFHFIISGVTRGFTHQMVRQRTGTYTQESTRFAVKETVPVGLPPSLDGTVTWLEWWLQCARQLYPDMPDLAPIVMGEHIAMTIRDDVDSYAEKHATQQQLWRRRWDRSTSVTEVEYNALVSEGMPAEDARGLLETNLLTKVNYNTSLRGLKDHAGVRLCTQAQYEWRVVWAAMLEAIREFGKTQTYFTVDDYGTDSFYAREKDPMGTGYHMSSAWQFDALADIFKPICYAKGRCQFMSNVDRACSIRDRVERMADLGIPSIHWQTGIDPADGRSLAIEPGEWMAEGTARVSQ